MTDADYTDDLALLANTPGKAKTLLYSLEQAAKSISLNMKTNKTGSMCLKYFHLTLQVYELTWPITYLGSIISSTKSDVNMRSVKALITNDKSIIGRSDHSDRIRRHSFRPVSVLVLDYGYTTGTLAKTHQEKSKYELNKDSTGSC